MTSKLSWQEVSRIEYLAEKMHTKRSIKLFFKLAAKVGINKLERNVGLVLEDPKIKNPIAYLVKLCQKNLEQ